MKVASLIQGMKSLPIMKSTQTCDQEVSTQGTITSMICHELHLFRPFSKDTSGATTEVTQKFTFKQQTTTRDPTGSSKWDFEQKVSRWFSVLVFLPFSKMSYI